MQTKDFMTEPVHCCTPDTSLTDIARIMAERDIGCLPVVASQENRKLVGMITDRDIVVRSLAQGHNPIEMTVADCMTTDAFTVHPDTGEEELCQLMEQHQVRRVPVVDDQNTCWGIVSLADIACKGTGEETAAVTRDISQAKPAT